MQSPTPQWPIPQVASILMFQAPHGAGQVTPTVTPTGTEKIEMITAGSVYHDAEEGEALALPGAVFWHLPGERTVHRYPANSAYECLCINLLPAARTPRLVPRYTRWDDVPSAQAFAREIIDYEAAGQLQQPAFGAYVYHRLFWNALAHGASTRHYGPSPLTDACTFIRANIAEHLTVETVARTIGISGPHLHRLFRQHFCRTPHSFILEERFQKACKLLRGTRLQSKEIAYQCGFRDAAEFSRTFRRFAGCSPREYRLPFLANALPTPAEDRSPGGAAAGRQPG